jgi:carboxyl-terminal processing protease
MKKCISLLCGLLFSIGLMAQNYSSDTLRSKCIVLRRFLEQNHYHPLEWNDSTSSRLFDRWLYQLDDEKVYLTQSDIDALSVYRSTLGTELKGDAWAFFDLSIKLYRRRLQQTDSIAMALLAKPFDFSKPDHIQWPYTSYASSDKELAKRWEQIYKWKVLDRIMDDEDSADRSTSNMPANFSKLELKAREAIKKQHLSKMNDVLQPSPYFEHGLGVDYLNTICWCYDPHTEYMNLSAKKEFETELSPFKYSAGIEVEENEKGQWTISKLVPGGPAWRNGDIHKGDVVLKIKSGDQPEQVLEDLSADEVLALLRGANDDKLLITLKREGGNEQAIALDKEKINDDQSIVKSFEIKDSVKVGYIELPDFYTEPDDDTSEIDNGCANDVAKEIVKLKEDNIKGLILDLRYDGGGSISEALELAGIFIDEGPLCSTKDRTGKVHFLRDPNRGTIYDGPLLVLVNSQSASASELVTAVLQDYHRALIVGGRTYGKGTEQQILPMDTTGSDSNNSPTGDYVKVTDGKFYRVDGTTTQWKGVLPDINLPDIYNDDTYREKGNTSALLPDNSKVAMYNALPGIPIASLQELSNTRVVADTDFTNLERVSSLVAQQIKGIDLPLQWSAFFSYMKKEDQLLLTLRANDGKAVKLHVGNNTFDEARAKFETKESNEVNDGYMDRVAGDDYVRESYKILMDWLKLQN